MSDFESMPYFPFHKKWAKVTEYADASMVAQCLVDRAMRLYMDRGSLPEGDKLRRALGCDAKEYARPFEEATDAIAILLPMWQETLTEAWTKVETIRERNRRNGQNGGRKPKPIGLPSGEPNGLADEPNSEPTGNPVGSENGTFGNPPETKVLKDKRLDPTDLIPHTPKPKKASLNEGPEGFDAFWDEFRARYPRRPGNAWSEGRKAMLKALRELPELNLAMVLEQVAAYRELMVSEKKDGTGYVAMAATWINQGRWGDDFGDAKGDGEDFDAGAF